MKLLYGSGFIVGSNSGKKQFAAQAERNESANEREGTFEVVMTADDRDELVAGVFVHFFNRQND